ncbi:MAG: DUF2141 domain-containing protein [Balneola sp.]|nr:DUF2141 domain-containing protein [Balneola sp.]MBO6651314.1 DUF2141 domain-containing protein [Balneola sp.]MBO6710810.1 DUF2141 domain-containing protein [Balneola sp.]MBO6799497.1 DUF2141 domain-containing protein [Balneola sp.]MBO6870229.1 DUF2141 domain-containing protein [Balneola sp.]
MRVVITLFLIAIFSEMSLKAQEISYPEKGVVTEFRLYIEGVDEIKGEIRIAMFDSKEKYTKDPVYAIVLPVDSTTIVWTQEMLPYGEYAIAVYHDKNENGKIDTNFLGIPKEDYGFSNNARGRFGPASWEDSKFKIEDTYFTTSINIK